MESIDKTVNAIASARFVLERTTANSVCKELRFVLQVLLDEAYESAMEASEAYERLEYSHAELWKQNLAEQNKAEEPKPESGPDPEWIVEKPVPVGSEAAKKICEKVRQQEEGLKKNAKFNGSIVAKKKGRPRKNDD